MALKWLQHHFIPLSFLVIFYDANLVQPGFWPVGLSNNEF